MTHDADSRTAEALAAWPRFLLSHVAFGTTLGALFTAALIGLDSRGFGSLLLASEAPNIAIAALALSVSALATCGLLATAMAQFETYPAPCALAEKALREREARLRDPRGDI